MFKDCFKSVLDVLGLLEWIWHDIAIVNQPRKQSVLPIYNLDLGILATFEVAFLSAQSALAPQVPHRTMAPKPSQTASWISSNTSSKGTAPPSLTLMCRRSPWHRPLHDGWRMLMASSKGCKRQTWFWTHEPMYLLPTYATNFYDCIPHEPKRGRDLLSRERYWRYWLYLDSPVDLKLFSPW